MGISADTARKRSNKYNAIKDLPLKTVLRKSKITAAWGLKIKKHILEYPLLSFRDRHDNLGPPFGVSIMRDYMIDNGIVPDQRQVRIVFKEEHKVKRLLFAQETLAKFAIDPEYWKKIIWSDEKKFRLNKLISQKVYYSHSKRDDMFISKQLYQDRIMLWG